MSQPQLAWVLLFTTAACGPGGGGNNTTPCNADLLPGDLVITEVFADADGADEGKEWFEIYNAGTQNVNLEGAVLVASQDTGDNEATHTMGSQIIEAGSYLVVGGVAQDLRPAWVDYGYGADLRVGSSRGLPNADGRLAITCGDVTVNEMTYGASTSGKSLELDGTRAPDYNQNDDRMLWCDAPDSSMFTTASFGTPGAANDACANVTPTMCNDGGTPREIVPPQLGDLVISETMAHPASPPGSADGEWLEVAVLADIDLNGLQLGQAEVDTGPKSVSQTLTSTDCLHVTAGSYVLFARNSDTAMNGGLPPVNFPLEFGLTDSTDGAFIGYDDSPLDVVTWTSSATGTARSLDNTSLDPTTNDDDRFWCDAVDDYGTAGMQGTPGAANPACDIAPPAGMCYLPGGGMRATVKPTAGQIAINEWMAAPSVTDANGEWLELLAKADFDLNGLELGQAETTGPKSVSQTLTSNFCLAVTSGDLILLARNATEADNGGIPPANINFILGFGLTNNDDGVFVGIDGGVLDTRTWSASPSGASCQVDPADGTSLCLPPTDGSATYGAGGDGTPAATNVCGAAATTTCVQL